MPTRRPPNRFLTLSPGRDPRPAPAHTTEPDPATCLAQIEKISQNARSTWFTLIALLLFTGVTLMGHRDSHFFAWDAATRLPLANIDVPPTSFFAVAPVLTAGLYIYLHIYLNTLWRAIAKAPARIPDGPGGDPLEERIYPTMLGIAAVNLRQWRRRDGSAARREIATLGISLIMTWLAGLIVIAFTWWRSMPYQNEWLTLWIGLWLWLALMTGAASAFHLWHGMKVGPWRPGKMTLRRWCWLLTQALVSVAILLGIVAVSWATTEGGLEYYWRLDETGEDVRTVPLRGAEPTWYWPHVEGRRVPIQYQRAWFIPPFLPRLTTGQVSAHFVPLVPADLGGAVLTGKPRNWLPYQLWLEEQEATYRRREGLASSGALVSRHATAFRQEARTRWAALTGSLDKISLRGKDLRAADLRGAFIAGADLRKVRLENANLSGAQLAGADLGSANLRNANFFRARLEGTNLSDADLLFADLNEAWLEGAELGVANFTFANLRKTRLQDADLADATLADARLEGADLKRADLSGANLHNAMLSDARLDETNLFRAEFNGAQMSDTTFARAVIRSTNFTGARDLSQDAINSAWGDCGTLLPEGTVRPDHWLIESLDRLDYDPGADLSYQAWLARGAPHGTPLAIDQCFIGPRNMHEDLPRTGVE